MVSVIFAVLEMLVRALTTVVKLLWEFLILILVHVANRNTSRHVTTYTQQWAQMRHAAVCAVLAMDSSWWSSRSNERRCDMPRSAQCSRWTVPDGVLTAMSADATCRGLRSARDGQFLMEFSQQWAQMRHAADCAVLAMDSSWCSSRSNERRCDMPRSAQCSRRTVPDGVLARHVNHRSTVYWSLRQTLASINLFSFDQFSWIAYRPMNIENCLVLGAKEIAHKNAHFYFLA